MKKLLYCLMLATGITGNLFAQPNTSRSDKTFDLPPNYAQRRYFIDLGKGNTMRIELINPDDLKRFSNMDSVIRVFLADMEPFNDSLGDELLSRRIDYTTDSAGRKQIRIQKFKPKGSSYLIQQGEAAALKLEQDTINILGTVSYIAKFTLRKGFATVRQYRISFFVNDFSDLAAYMDGSLNRKLEALQNSTQADWNSTATKGKARLNKEPSITAKLPGGYVAGGTFLNFRLSADAQNYKNYFVPYFSLGAGIIFSNSHFKRDIIVSWDPNFFFGRDNLGKLRTYRNDFITLTWGQGPVKDNEPRLESHLLFIMSLGYLINRQGDFVEKNTFRIGAGRLSLFSGKTKIEPALYFDHFFKGVTPTVRLIQSF